MKKLSLLPRLVAFTFLVMLTSTLPTKFSSALAGLSLEQNFAHPPDSARPWVYWFWLNGNITSNGITADLEAMKRVGIGGVLIMEVDQGSPKGEADFGQGPWRQLFKHVCSEANRLGLEVNMNNDAGWCGSGGPWITAELSMQRLVWTETNILGPQFFDAQLTQPTANSNYYGDIVLYAFPMPSGDARIDDIQAKSANLPQHVRIRSDWPATPKKETISRDSIVNLSAQMNTNGHFTWNVPEGKWTVLRIGHTTTGKDNHPAPTPGRGLESDKLSRASTDAMFAGLMGKLISDSKPLAGQTLVSTHIDSWETGSQNWTPLFRENFRELRGYDPLPYFPVITGRIVESREVSERFLWDLRQTVSDLLLKNYAGRFRELAHKKNMRLSIEAYDGAPCDEMMFAGQADEPMSEFWSWSVNTAYSCTEMASAAHTYGKRILGAEAFTATDGEKWQHHPASIKALGDWAFCEGINRFVFHRYALQPWRDVAPGMSMGPWGLHYERTQTWWEQSTPWHEYLARCQYLLRRGLFVADICFLQPEGSPRRFVPRFPGCEGSTPDRPGYNFDGCTPEVVLNRMKVRDGRLVLPDGMNYRMLVLPQVDTMSPTLLRKIKSLAEAGATIVGPPPRKSPSLTGFPACDAEVARLSYDLWGTADSRAQVSRAVGKGRIIWGLEFAGGELAPEQSNPLQKAKWIWRNEGKPAEAAPVGKRYFMRSLNLDTNRTLTSAKFNLTADNIFELWVNGKRVGSGENFARIYTFNVAKFLKPGENYIAIAVENISDHPNPAGLIGSLSLTFDSGPALETFTDKSWRCAETAPTNWFRSGKFVKTWNPAIELGPLGMQPWATPGKAADGIYKFPEFEAITNLLAGMSVPPDFEAGGNLRYIHRRDGDTDIYFLANPASEPRTVTCTFRVAGKEPEMLDPLTGQASQPLAYEEKDGRTVMTLAFETTGSRFVVFHKHKRAPKNSHESIVAIIRNGANLLPANNTATIGTSPIQFNATSQGTNAFFLISQSGKYIFRSTTGKTRTLDISIPASIDIPGPWTVSFQHNHGPAETLAFPTLTDWAQHTDARVKYFSGTARYTRTISLPPAPTTTTTGRRLYLDLGKVGVIASVKLNGKDLGVLWRAPFTVDITDAATPGNNQLEINVVNLWINRMIGDEQLPADSDRTPRGNLKEWPQWLVKGDPSPAGRQTFSSWQLWKKDSPLQESGLLGPVHIVTAQEANLNWKEDVTVSLK